jgi:hypothetical protein
MLVEAAWSPPAPRARCGPSIERIKARRGFAVAVVATARKLAVIAWHLVTGEQD